MKRADHIDGDGDGTEMKRPRLHQPDVDDDRGGQQGYKYSKWPPTIYYSTARSDGAATSDQPSSDCANKEGSGARKEGFEPNGQTALGRSRQYPKGPLTSSSSGVSTITGAATITGTAKSPRNNKECSERRDAKDNSSRIKKNSALSAHRQERSRSVIEKPHANDVLCGRGPGFYSHHGNVAFRKLANDRKAKYVLASSHDEKTMITKEVLERMGQLDPPVRFLERSASREHWVETDPEKRFAKVSQTLREGAPTIRDQARAAVLGGKAKNKTVTHAAALGLGSKGTGDTPVGDLTPAQLKVRAELVINGYALENGTHLHTQALDPFASSPASFLTQQHAARIPVGSFNHQATEAVPSLHVAPSLHVHINGGATQATSHTHLPAPAANSSENSGHESLFASLNASLLANTAEPSNGYESLLASLNAPLLAPSNVYESLLASLNASLRANTAAPSNGYESLLAILNASLLAAPSNTAVDFNQDAQTLHALRMSVSRSHLLRLLRAQHRN